MPLINKVRFTWERKENVLFVCYLHVHRCWRTLQCRLRLNSRLRNVGQCKRQTSWIFHKHYSMQRCSCTHHKSLETCFYIMHLLMLLLYSTCKWLVLPKTILFQTLSSVKHKWCTVCHLTKPMRFTYQVIFFVVHLGRVTPHAVDGEEQVHEGEWRVQPQEVIPEAQGERDTSTLPRILKVHHDLFN